MERNRIIGEYTEGIPGPLLICIGATHGNEPAGVRAIELMTKMLEVENIANPHFDYKGAFLGIIGNLTAFSANKRFLDRDMNRSWFKSEIDRVLNTAQEILKNEDLELRAVYELIKFKIDQYQPTNVIVLDLHTTSSDGGIFAITNRSKESLRIAKKINAPVIMNMLNGIKGTTLNFFVTENFGIDMTTVAFESGQHVDPISTNRSIAGITNTMGSIGAIDPKHIENRHNSILDEYCKGLPRVTTLKDKYHIDDITKFQMLPGFKNFDPIKKGQHLANYDGEQVLASVDGLIVMPLYQKQGEDGFFIVETVRQTVESNV